MKVTVLPSVAWCQTQSHEWTPSCATEHCSTVRPFDPAILGSYLVSSQLLRPLPFLKTLNIKNRHTHSIIYNILSLLSTHEVVLLLHLPPEPCSTTPHCAGSRHLQSIRGRLHWLLPRLWVNPVSHPYCQGSQGRIQFTSD